MDILVIGSGGREHTLTWKLAQSKLVDKIYTVPGNPGMEKIAQCIPGSVEDNEFLVKVAQEKKSRFSGGRARSSIDKWNC